MFKNLKISQRLIGSFIIMAGIVGITGTLGIWSINRVGDQVKTILKNRASQEKAVLLLELSQKACRVNLLDASLVRTEKDEFQRNVKTYREKRDLFRKYINALLNGDPQLGVQPAPKGSHLEELCQNVLKSWGKFEAVAEELIAHKTKLLAPLTPGVIDAAAMQAMADERLNVLAREEIMETSETAKLDIDDLADTIETAVFQAGKESEKIRLSAIIALVIVSNIALVLAIFLGLMTARNIIRRIKEMGSAVNQGSAGDLSVVVNVDSRDEIGHLGSDFNEMLGKLSEMVGKVNHSADELGQISGNLSAVSKRVIRAAEQQAIGVGDTSSAVIQINASVKGVANGVDSLALSATESSTSVLEMAASIEEVAMSVETLSQSAEEVSSSIIEMAASIKQIGQSVQTLMEASSTTASSVMEMDSSIKQVERHALDTAAISEKVQLDAEGGKASVEATILGIQEIRRSSQITFEVISNLSTKTDDIGTILSVIDDVAEQTNLLALNAAIIASQAGEHGKGFAVVADEIKELAERTASSTREIANVIKGVQQETRRAVEAINLAEKRITEGEQLSNQSGEALAKIVAGVRKASEQVGEIARTTVEQARGSQMIRDAMEQVSQMVGQIAHATREQGKGSELIMTAVERMKGLTLQVRSSTSEQSKAGNLIARSTERITDMIQQIKRACDEQLRGGEQIVMAVENIQQSTAVNLDASKVMEDSVARLSQQTNDLHKEVGAFTVIKQ